MVTPSTLRRNSRGSQVEVLQLGLVRSGFYKGDIDGIFGTNTETALKSFQSAGRLTPDGIAGKYTWKALKPFLIGAKKYIIKRGDTLYSISRRYNITVRAIMTANPDIDYMNLPIGAEITVPLGFSVVPENVSMSSLLMQYITEGLILRYPFIHLETIGYSQMGAEIYAFKIGIGKRKIFYNAAHHANEYITSTLLTSFIEEYALSYSQNRTISGFSAVKLYESASLFAVPLVNPDGVDLVTGSLNSGSYFENAVKIGQNYPNIPFPSGWKANISGTDLNLQYPAGWQEAREIKFAQGFISPAPRDYVGASPLSEPESRAVYEYTLRHNFDITVSYHTQGEVIFWKYLDYEVPCAEEIGMVISRLSGYLLELTPTSSGYAGYKDWFIKRYLRPGYTFEVGLGTSPLPKGQISKIKSNNFPVMAYLLSENVCTV